MDPTHGSQRAAQPSFTHPKKTQTSGGPKNTKRKGTTSFNLNSWVDRVKTGVDAPPWMETSRFPYGKRPKKPRAPRGLLVQPAGAWERRRGPRGRRGTSRGTAGHGAGQRTKSLDARAEDVGFVELAWPVEVDVGVFGRLEIQ